MKYEKEDVLVAYAADENVVAGLYVSIYTILKNISKNRKYKILILDGGIKNESKEKIKSLEREKINVTIEYKKAPTDIIKNLEDPDKIGRSAYLLLLVPEVLGSNKKKVLYLDADTVVTQDIKKLYDKSVKNVTCLAVQEYLSTNMKYASRVTQLPQIIDCEPEDPYFNSGVLLINVERWLKYNVTSKAVKMLSKHPDKLSVADQDALNGVLHDKWRVLNFKWNVQLHFLMEKCHANPKYENPNYNIIKDFSKYEDLIDSAGILHFNNQPKPWMSWYTGPYREEFHNLIYESKWKVNNTFKGKVKSQLTYILFKYKNILYRNTYCHGVKPILVKALNIIRERLKL